MATHATQQRGVWVVSYGEPNQPGEVLARCGLVVTNDGNVYTLSSVTGSLDNLLMDLGHSPLLDERPPWPEVLGQENASWMTTTLTGVIEVQGDD